MLEFVLKNYDPSGYSGPKHKIEKIDVIAKLKTYASYLKSDERTGFPDERTIACAPLFTTYTGQRDFWLRKLHIPAVDCDSEKARETILQSNKELLGKRYIEVESSPGRYWIFFDISYPFQKRYDFVHRLIGIDREHLEMCKKYKRFMFRAFPKQTGYPRVPKMGMQNTIASKWFWELWNYFNSQVFEETHEILGLVNKKNCQNCDNQKYGNFCFECGSPIRIAHPLVHAKRLLVDAL